MKAQQNKIYLQIPPKKLFIYILILIQNCKSCISRINVPVFSFIVILKHKKSFLNDLDM